MMIRRSRIASAIRSAAESPKGKKLPPVYHEKLKALALEAKREYLRTCQPTPDAHILSGHCGSATEFLVGYLQKRGIPAKIVNGVYFFKGPEDEEYYHPGNSLGHNWVEAYGHVIDITGEELQEFPPTLYPFTGQGLYIWQYPNQLAQYWAFLAERVAIKPITSYLEIGVRRGGTFLATLTYLETVTQTKIRALGLDLQIDNTLKAAADQNKWSVLPLNSHSPECSRLCSEAGPWDLVLIDGDHSYPGVKRDYETVSPYARILALHDITNRAVPDVGRFWQELKTSPQEQSQRPNYREFTDQYPGVPNGPFLGIGVCY
jgi:hypothetical protein